MHKRQEDFERRIRQHNICRDTIYTNIENELRARNQKKVTLSPITELKVCILEVALKYRNNGILQENEALDFFKNNHTEAKKLIDSFIRENPEEVERIKEKFQKEHPNLVNVKTGEGIVKGWLNVSRDDER